MEEIKLKKIACEITQNYTGADEKNRLKSGIGPLEFERMKELLIRYLPSPPAKVCDIGGAAGEYSFWFARQGYEAHLVDIVPEHIKEAKAREQEPGEVKLASARVGNALDLHYEDNTFDAVFMAGPLYHLVDRIDRIQALKEANRVIKPNGVMVAYSITRYATLMAGLVNGNIYNESFMDMLRREILTGQHIAPYNTALKEAYFHLPNELKEEVEESGLKVDKILGVLGPAWMALDFETNWNDKEKREAILEVARLTENQPELGPRTMIIARKLTTK